VDAVGTKTRKDVATCTVIKLYQKKLLGLSPRVNRPSDRRLLSTLVSTFVDIEGATWST
jgi:hypothetical protein